MESGENVPIREESMDELQEFMNDPRFTHFVGMVSPPRPGVAECFTVLEHTHYPPGTERNDDYIMRVFNWRGMLWTLVSIPTSDVHLMEVVADECGLRIADGVPTMLGSGGAQQFPVNNDRVFTLENKEGHPVYRNDPAVNKALLEGELLAIQHINRKKQKT